MAMRDWFEAYLEAFNRGDFPGFGRFYADDVRFHGQAATLVGRDAVLGFYREVRAYLDERIELLAFAAAADGARLQVELRTTLVAHRDWPEMPTGAMMKGDRKGSISFVRYDVADPQTPSARFTRIRSARFSGLPPQ